MHRSTDSILADRPHPRTRFVVVIPGTIPNQYRTSGSKYEIFEGKPVLKFIFLTKIKSIPLTEFQYFTQYRSNILNLSPFLQVMDDRWETEVMEYSALNITGFRIVDNNRRYVKEFLDGWKRLDPAMSAGAGKESISVSSYDFSMIIVRRNRVFL